MKSHFWRYQIILIVLYIFWSNFFDTDIEGLLSQLVFNFALFYPLGFLVGYRPKSENLGIAYFSAILFNSSSYVLAMAVGSSIQDWTIIIVDYVSLIFFLEIGLFIGKRTHYT